jgi:hypothetical protein
VGLDPAARLNFLNHYIIGNFASTLQRLVTATNGMPAIGRNKSPQTGGCNSPPPEFRAATLVNVVELFGSDWPYFPERKAQDFTGHFQSLDGDSCELIVNNCRSGQATLLSA